MKCPDCDNGKTGPPSFVRWSPGRKPKTEAEMKQAIEKLCVCHLCDGKGEVPDHTAEWIAQGNAFRELRIRKGLGLRRAADILGVRASEISDAELGKVQIPKWLWKQLRSTE